MRGGRREGAGRPPSSMQATRAASLAREHVEQAIAILVDLMHNAQSEHTRVAAANAILDRGWGKPVAPTHLEGDNLDYNITVTWVDADKKAAPSSISLA